MWLVALACAIQRLRKLGQEVACSNQWVVIQSYVVKVVVVGVGAR